MQERLGYGDIGADAIKALGGVEAYIRKCGLDPRLIELVKIRASQVNGCAYCLDVHRRDARQLGETEQRLYLLNAWDESPLYTPLERAAPAWTESLARIAETHGPDAIYEQVRPQFTDKELVDLTVLIGMINLWNRLAIAFRRQYTADAKAAA